MSHNFFTEQKLCNCAVNQAHLPERSLKVFIDLSQKENTSREVFTFQPHR